MHLIEVDRNKMNGKRQLAPSSPKDMWLFQHCTGGCIAVTEDAFFDKHMSVFKAHGINCTLPTEFVLTMRHGAQGAK